MVSLLVSREALNPRYCPADAIGYLRDLENGVAIAGGNARFSHVGPHGYFLTAWFPSKDPQVRIFISVGDDIREISYEGRGSIRMHRGRTFCAFPAPKPETYPGVPQPSPSP
jgi:hypothetical protein